MNKRLHVLILAGGAGRRLWPWSRPGSRKPELPLINSKTPLEETIQSALVLAPPEQIHLVAAEGYLAGNYLGQRIIESKGRNTFPAILRGAQEIHALNAESVVLVLPADHHVVDRDPWRAGLLQTVDSLLDDSRSFWIHGTSADPSPEFGCITWDQAQGDLRFVEKPSLSQVQELLVSTGSESSTASHFRHCGIFGFGSDFFLKRMAQRGVTDPDQAPAESIDHFLLGSSDFAQDLKFRPLDYRWSDLGDWRTIRQMRRRFTGLSASVAIREEMKPELPVYPSGPDMILDGTAPLIHGASAQRKVFLGMPDFELVLGDQEVELNLVGSESWCGDPPIIFNTTDQSIRVRGMTGGLIACMKDLLVICSESALEKGLLAEASRFLDGELLGDLK